VTLLHDGADRSDEAGAVAARRRSQQRLKAAVAGGVMLVIAVGALLAVTRDDSDSSSPAASTPVAPTLPSATDSAQHTPVVAGTYLLPASGWSVRDVTLTVPPGWAVQYGHLFAKNGDVVRSELAIYPVLVDEVFADPCRGDLGDIIAVAADDDLGAALIERSGEFVSGRTPTTVSGLPAVRYDISIPEGFQLSRCTYGDVGVQIWHSTTAEKYFVLLAEGKASVYIFEIDGRQQAIVTQQGPSSSPADVAELEAILDSIRIAG
jgi:hypothetical protein